MGILGNLTVNVLEEGFIYGIMALGVYITYSVLSFPDLSVDGTFPLGMCFAAMCITAGVNPWLTCVLTFMVGCLAGAVTGFLHVKLKITDLLSGILVMTGLWSINLVLTGGAAVLPFYNKPTIFNSGPGSLLPLSFRVMIVSFLIVVVVKLAIDGFLKSKAGLLLRATGDNNRFVVSLAQNPGKMKVIGLMIGNGCTALAGCVLSQQTESANVTGGTGMVVMALASVIIGTNLFGRLSFLKATTAVIFGAVTYKACLSIAMQVGLPTNYLKLLMAVLFTVALVSSRVYRKEDS